MSARVLIVYGSNYGQTAKIAERIAGLLRRREIEVTVHKGDQLPPALALRRYDGILVGASLITGRYQKYIRKFVRNNAAALRAVPCAFFAVSGSAAGRPDERAEAQGTVDQFFAATGWNPDLTVCLGGAISFTKYNPLLRWIMKRIMSKGGHPLDPTRDHELTDWSEVERFTEAFNALVNVPAEATC
jgi:menaquinone-dependent protoporphyrinogen oxidase